MHDYIVLCDTRQKSDKHIIDYFERNLIPWIRTGLPSADYMAIRYKDKVIKDYSVLIDTKKDIEEISGNLCNTTEHERIKKEILRAKELGCEDFIFLICSNKIKTIDDLKQWRSKRTKVKGEVLLKIMATMSKKYHIRFIFTTKQKAGKKIIELLQNSELAK